MHLTAIAGKQGSHLGVHEIPARAAQHDLILRNISTACFSAFKDAPDFAHVGH